MGVTRRWAHVPPLSSLTAVTPIDGRYADKVLEMREHVSEHALIKYRVKVEVEWIRLLSKESVRGRHDCAIVAVGR